jgi:uncharacterized membrane protein
MTELRMQADSSMRRASALFARLALGGAMALSVVGLLAASAGVVSASTPLLATACLLLILVPVVNVLSELVDEVRRRDWAFVAAAAVVLTLITYSAISRLN